MNGRANSLGVLLALVSVPAAAQTAQGMVFEDLDRDGRRGPGEPGPSNVRVSNGLEVVVTDTEGRYALEVGSEAVVFITKPSGYATPVNSDQLPRFFYLHQPKGSPSTLRFPGIAPTGAVPESIDPLVRQQEPARFRALLFSDTQPQSEAEVDFIRDTVVPEVIGANAAFGMTMGDILFDDLCVSALQPRRRATQRGRVLDRHGSVATDAAPRRPGPVPGRGVRTPSRVDQVVGAGGAVHPPVRGRPAGHTRGWHVHRARACEG